MNTYKIKWNEAFVVFLTENGIDIIESEDELEVMFDEYINTSSHAGQPIIIMGHEYPPAEILKSGDRDVYEKKMEEWMEGTNILPYIRFNNHSTGLCVRLGDHFATIEDAWVAFLDKKRKGEMKRMRKITWNCPKCGTIGRVCIVAKGVTETTPINGLFPINIGDGKTAFDIVFD
ncbi:MAG: hypothetical protein Q8M92_02655, partial [Candidatus Subteraquimicrobiales bacterium]|nr:hypothetical protein [Candidatus Subteraquimicrobiales bacterium]